MKNFSIQTAIFLLLLVSGASGCRKQVCSGPDYVSFIENPENHLQIERNIDGVKFSAQYQPSEYLLFKARHNKQSPDEQEVQLSDLEDYTYFTFKIGSEQGNQSVLEKNDGSRLFYERLNYCSFMIQKDFFLIEGEDTLTCTLCHFERNYNLAPYNTFNLAFERKTNTDRNKDLVLVYNDKLFSLGPMKFLVEHTAIENLPHIKGL